jgi:riboflavin biosynthesis pyrimidine reductase
VGLYDETAARLPQQAVLTGSGTLPAAGLVDRVSTVVAPVVAGSGAGTARPAVAATDRETTPMRLTSVEQLRDGHVWLRHERR